MVSRTVRAAQFEPPVYGNRNVKPEEQVGRSREGPSRGDAHRPVEQLGRQTYSDTRTEPGANTAQQDPPVGR